MSFTLKLNPPQLVSKLPAFYGTQMIIPFNLNRAVGFNQFDAIVAIVKTVSTGTQKAFLIAGSDGEGKNYGKIWYDTSSRSYRALFDFSEQDFAPEIGQYYKVQIAFVNAARGTNDYQSAIGYYSSVGVIKYSAEPTLYIKGLDENGSNKNTYEYTGVYLQEHDMSEKIYSYEFNLYDDSNNIIATTGKLIHNNSVDIDVDSSNDSWRIRKNLAINKPYYLQYKAITLNGLGEMLPCESPKYKIVELDVGKPDINANLSAVSNEVEGYIKISLIGLGGKNILDNALRSGSFILLRSCSKDNFDTWEQLTEFQLSLYDPKTNKDLYRDYTVEQGRHYIYAIQAYNQYGYMSGRQLNIEGKVRCDFEDAFLYDGDRQLKIRFNPTIDSFKPTILENKIDTIGSKYPFIFRNGIVNYKEFSISGLLSLLGDENQEFFKDVTVSKATRNNNIEPITVESLHQLTGESYYKERQFKLEALEWLSNGQPKLFKSPAEGNYIVRLMGVSLSPEVALGRMLHTFDCNACEIAPFDFESLDKYNLIPGYSDIDDLRYHTIDLTNVELQFQPVNNVGNNIIMLPQVYEAKIIGKQGTKFYYHLLNDTSVYTATIGPNGFYEFSKELLRNFPLIKIELGQGIHNWGNNATLFIGYRDPRIKLYSYIYDVSSIQNETELPKDFDSGYEQIPDQEIILPPFWNGKIEDAPIPETPEEDKSEIEDNENIEKPTNKPGKWWWMKDILKFLEDLHKKTGMFHYINISHRDWCELKKENGIYTGFYKNGQWTAFDKNYDVFNPNDLYLDTNGRYYFDGWDLCNLKDKAWYNSKPKEEVTNKFVLNDTIFNLDAYTKGDFQTFTDLSCLNNFKIGNGLKVEIVYQEKEVTYEVENPNSDLYNENVIKAKEAWQNLLQNNGSSSEISKAYSNYLNILQEALNKVKNETEVGVNNVIYAI